MAVVVHSVLAGVTKEQYDAVQAAADWLSHAPDGGRARVTWWEGTDCHTLDTWESEAAFKDFGAQRLGPAMAQLGVLTPAQVTFYMVHAGVVP